MLTDSKSPVTGPHGRTGADTRQLILQATARLIVERGHRATTLKAVSKVVGISEPAIYKHFASRSDVMAAAFAGAMRLFPISRLEREGRRKIEQITELAAMLTDPDLYPVRRLGVEMHTAAALEDEYAAIMAAHNDRHAAGLREMIEAAVAAGSADPGVNVAFTQWYIHVLMIGLSHQDTLGGALIGDPDWRTFIAAAVCDLLRSPPSSTPTEMRPPAAPITRAGGVRHTAGGPPGRRRAGADTRRRILHEAALLIASHGYHGTTMKAVAARVGVSEPAVYRHFDNKASLMAAVFAATGRRTSYREMVLTGHWEHAIIPTYVTLLSRSDMHLVRRLAVEMFAAAPIDADVLAITHAHVTQVTGGLRALLNDGIACGALAPGTDVERTLWYVLVVMLGLSHLETLCPALIGNEAWDAFVYGAIGKALRPPA